MTGRTGAEPREHRPPARTHDLADGRTDVVTVGAPAPAHPGLTTGYAPERR
ncbi:hypothetical protein [Streptomyces bungoensis]|uniref:hypothetical protein n=1 Tax=Streptomyces bungoensis TaxID=285568 RepID=UPI0033E1DB26